MLSGRCGPLRVALPRGAFAANQRPALALGLLRRLHARWPTDGLAGRARDRATELAVRVEEEARAGLVTVGAITADFTRDVLEEKGDLDAVGPYLSGRDPEHAAHAEKGMRRIRDARLLDSPDDGLLRRTYRTLKGLHEQAYRWTAPDVAWPEVLAATPMRTYVRGWINAWDVRRLYPDSRADEEGYDYDRVVSSYREEPGLENERDEE